MYFIDSTVRLESMELFEKKKNLDNAELKAKFLKLLRAEMDYYQKYFTKNIQNIIKRKQVEQNVESEKIHQEPIANDESDIGQCDPRQASSENRISMTNENLAKNYKKMSQIHKNIEEDEKKFVETKRKVRKGWFSESKNIFFIVLKINCFLLA